MKKKDLIKALENFEDDDHIVIGDESWSWVPKIRRICGGRQYYMAYYCILEKGHDGGCYCGCKMFILNQKYTINC
jgi:hypothetical protein